MDFEELCDKSEVLPSLISVIDNCDKLQEILGHIKRGIDFIGLYPVEDVENVLKYLMPKILQITERICTENNAMIPSKESTVLDNFKENLQVALNLLDISNQILEYIVKHDTVPFANIPSVPLNMSLILYTTFKHCKDSLKISDSFVKSIIANEMLNVFRKTQEVHSNFLNFLDTCLDFDHTNEKETAILIKLLDLLLKISKILSGVNIKSMAENWKCFLSLIQKYPNVPWVKSDIISLAVESLTEEVGKNIQTIFELGSTDLKKSAQLLKIVGFLIKVTLKLFEIETNLLENGDLVFGFCLTIYRWHYGCFITNNIPEEFTKAINGTLYSNTESLVNQLFRDSTCIEKLSLLDEKSSYISKNSFAVLNLSNDFLKRLPNILRSEPETICASQIVCLLKSVFNCIHNCHKEYFYDYNSFFYKELVVNISVAVLLIPNDYFQVEELLLKYVTQDKIWPALVAIEVWSLVLRCSSGNICQLTFDMLVSKIRERNVEIFVPAPAIIHLKILVQRILKSLPRNVLNQVVSNHGSTGDLQVWKILNLKNVPLSQRFYIELILNDLFEKINNLGKQEVAFGDIVSLAESMEIISYTTFTELQINTSKLLSSILRLWSLNIKELSPSNDFSRYFIQGLVKLTIALSRDLTGEHLLLILHQLKQLLNETMFKLLTCDVLLSIASRHFNKYQEKFSLFSTITDIFQILLEDKNPIITQNSLEVFCLFSENSSYEIVLNKLKRTPSLEKTINNFINKTAAGVSYSSDYFESLQNLEYKHQCLKSSDLEVPQAKKIKLDNEVADDVIASLKGDVLKLSLVLRRMQLNPRQVNNIKDVINSLEGFVK